MNSTVSETSWAGPTTPAEIVIVSPTMAVLMPVPPAMVNVSVVVFATVEPESDVMVSHKFYNFLSYFRRFFTMLASWIVNKLTYTSFFSF